MKRSLLISVLVVTLAAVFGFSPAQSQPPRLIDHYLFYHTVQPFTFMPTQQVTLMDQFGFYYPPPDFVMEAFGNPVDKNGEDILDPRAHLSMWRVMDTPTDEFEIGVSDQFGYDIWRVKDAVYLLLPALKDESGEEPPQKDHYLCYNVVDGPLTQIEVHLADQWGSSYYLLGRAVLWCNPVEKVVDGIPYPIIHNAHHLAVYELLNPPMFDIGFYWMDQFMEGNNIADMPMFLAVPAAKEFPVPVQESTWGHIKSLYR